MEDLLQSEFWYRFFVGVAENVVADGVKILIAGFFVLVGTLLWRFRRAARKRNLVEIRKRVESDEYFADRRRLGVIQLMTIFGFGIVALQLFMLGRAGDPRSTTMALMMVLAQYFAIGSAVIEHRYYRWALDYRMRRERRRKNLQTQRESLLGDLDPRLTSSRGPPPP